MDTSITMKSRKLSRSLVLRQDGISMMKIDAISQQESPNKYLNKLTVKFSFCKRERKHL